LATRDYFARFGVKGKLIDGRLVNLGIGQGEIGVTPLQMAVYCAALANGGTMYVPHVVRSYYYKESKRMEKNAFDSLKLPINKEYFDVVKRGMFAVCNIAGGTATNVKVDSVKVCGKTGTAQNPHGKDHAWFICYAPAENPTIAMCVMVENAGFGGVKAAPIARKILDAYFHPDRYKESSTDSTATKKPAPDSSQTAESYAD
ncbi:MAG: penicillin-binding protein 2, partial [Candidatus Kapabacteria bacterium]|nr:penicillin-binding protein 2 [Candidatus Kapabacteria bacterium]